MNCEQAERWMLLMRTGELPLRKRIRLGRHLAACAHCRMCRDDMERILSGSKEALLSEEPGVDTLSAVRDAAVAGIRKSTIPVRERSAQRIVVRWRPVLACAALVLVCLAGWYLLSKRQFPSIDTRSARVYSDQELLLSSDEFSELFTINSDDMLGFEQISELTQRSDVNALDMEIMILDGLAI